MVYNHGNASRNELHAAVSPAQIAQNTTAAMILLGITKVEPNTKFKE